MKRATISAWEFEQLRDTSAALSRLRGQTDIGECSWTGRTDNVDLGTRTLRNASENDLDDYDDYDPFDYLDDDEDES